MAKILTIDLGTTFFKACLFDENGHLVALEHIAPPIQRAHRGWFELYALTFEETVRSLLKQLRQKAGGFADVAAVSFATQTNTFRLLEENDWPWSPMILWIDERSLDQQPKLDKIVQTPNFRARTGVPELNGQFMIGHLLRWAEHNPAWPKVRKVSLISDELTRWFTGQHVTEAGAAGLTGMIDIHTLQWIPEICAHTKLDMSCFARIARAGTDLGPVLPAIAQEFGLPKGCRFVVGAISANTSNACNAPPDWLVRSRRSGSSPQP